MAGENMTRGDVVAVCAAQTVAAYCQQHAKCDENCIFYRSDMCNETNPEKWDILNDM